MNDRVKARSKKRRRPPTYRAFARTLTLPGGPLKGHPYDPDSDPCQSYLINQMDAGQWERIYVCAPPQLGGKTIIGILLPALRNAVALRLPVGYALPTLQDLDKAWSEKIKPAIKGSGFGLHLPQSGPGARGGRGHTLEFTDPETGDAEGMLVFLAGGAYGSTVAVVAVDEVDQFRTADGAPMWEALEDCFQRANAYGRRALRIAVGTIEHDERSIILPLVQEQGTGTRPWAKCPHCNRYQLLSFTQVTYDATDEESARESARLACQHCATLWTEDDRQRAVRAAKFIHRGQTIDEAGDVIGNAPRTTALGLLWTALDSSLGDLREICVDHLRAKRQLETRTDHGLMRKFYRYRLCECYTGDKIDDAGLPQQVSRTYLAARSEGSTYNILERTKERDGDGYWIAECPPEVEAISVGIDVQRGGQKAPGRLYYVATGFDQSFRTWDLSWGSLILAPAGHEPSTGQLHTGLDRMSEHLRKLSDQFGRSIVRRGVDVGDRQDEIHLWLKRAPEYSAVKGSNQSMRATEREDIAGWVYRREQEGRFNIWFIDTSQVRRQAQMQFLVPPNKPGAGHLPRGLIRSDSLITHYCGTAEVPDGRGGTRWSERQSDRQHHADWQYRHDLLDCRTYGLALAYQWLRDGERRRAWEDYQKAAAETTSTTGSDWSTQHAGGESWI